eukprot:1971_1
MALRRIAKELKDIEADPPPYWTVYPISKDNLLVWECVVQGPSNTPYEHGLFKLSIKFPKDYPFNPPDIKFQTKIYHCNINDEGVIKLHILHKGCEWSPALTVTKVLIAITSLLLSPDPDDPLKPNLATLFKEDRTEYNRIAKYWTFLYAEKPIDYKLAYQILNQYLDNIFQSQNEIIEPIICWYLGSAYQNLTKYKTAFLQPEKKETKNEIENIRDAPIGTDKYIIVKTLTGKQITIYCWLDETINILKYKLEQIEGIPMKGQRLIFAGKQLENNKLLKDYNMSYGCMVYLVLRL